MATIATGDAGGGGGRFGVEAVENLRSAFDRSRHPMLIVDDQRRWVTGNAAACDLLAIARDEIPWRTMDDFTPPEELQRLTLQWGAFLGSGVAEGWFDLYVPERGRVPVEFSAIANVLPARHLAVLIPPEPAADAPSHEPPWTGGFELPPARTKLTKREREVMTLVATGSQSADIAERLYLSSETVNTHVNNARSKLGAHTRAHAVAIALVTGQIVIPDETPRD